MKNIILVLLSLIITLISYSQETRKELRERSPNRLVLQLNGGVFSNYTYDIDPTSNEFINQKFRMSSYI